MEKITLCGANSYQEKYYFNEEFSELPEEVKNELKAACVLFTEEAGGIITLEFDAEGSLMVNIASDERDYLYDEIEAQLLVRKLLSEKSELFEKLELYFRAKSRLQKKDGAN